MPVTDCQVRKCCIKLTKHTLESLKWILYMATLVIKDIQSAVQIWETIAFQKSTEIQNSLTTDQE